MKAWWYSCWMKVWQIEGRNLFQRIVLGFCWYSRATVLERAVEEANGFELCQYNERRVEAENNCASVHIFQSLPLAMIGWGMRKKEGPRLISVLDVYLFFLEEKEEKKWLRWWCSTSQKEFRFTDKHPESWAEYVPEHFNGRSKSYQSLLLWLDVLTESTYYVSYQGEMLLAVSNTVAHVEIGRQKSFFTWTRNNLGMWKYKLFVSMKRLGLALLHEVIWRLLRNANHDLFLLCYVMRLILQRERDKFLDSVQKLAKTIK